MRKFLSLGGALALLAVIVASCATAPYTGRKQLLLLSQDEESQMGLQAYQEVKTGHPVSNNAAWTAMVNNVGAHISVAADRKDFQWEFRVIAEPTVNAFCLPGGKVAFYEGIMPVCQDETGVAVVMGHEVAHALARHGGERVSHGMIEKMGTDAVSQILGSKDPTIQAGIAGALGMGVQVASTLPFSREQESEADHIGLILMAKAGYDPRQAPVFWERMLKAGGDRPPEILSTHPDPVNRIAQLKLWMPEALPYYEKSAKAH